MFSIDHNKGFVIHADTNEVQIGRQMVKLSPKEMGVLQVLNDRNGKTVSRIELLDEVWGHEFANNQGLTQAISKLRSLFAENPNLSIRTIPKKGYLFQRSTVEPKKPVLRQLIAEPRTILLVFLLALVCVLIFVRRIQIRIDTLEPDSQESVLIKSEKD